TPCSLTGPRRPASGRAGSPSGCAPSLSPLFFLLIPPPPTSTLFPYTTLFRSLDTNVLLAVLVVDVLLLLYRAVAIIDAYRVTARSEEHTSELQSRGQLVCRLLLEKKKTRVVRSSL